MGFVCPFPSSVTIERKWNLMALLFRFYFFSTCEGIYLNCIIITSWFYTFLYVKVGSTFFFLNNCTWQFNLDFVYTIIHQSWEILKAPEELLGM